MSRKSFNARWTNWKLVINRILWVGNYRRCYYCYWECGLGSLICFCTTTDGSKMQCRLGWEILHLRFRFRFVGNESDKFPKGFRRTVIVVSAYRISPTISPPGISSTHMSSPFKEYVQFGLQKYTFLSRSCLFWYDFCNSQNGHENVKFKKIFFKLWYNRIKMLLFYYIRSWLMTENPVM